MGKELMSSELIGVVIIGRNEGKRFKRCVRSLLKQPVPVVYVDSGSTDGSVDFAKNMNCEVVNLDLSAPFTAARARNEGVKALSLSHPNLQFIQFVDGDCEIASSWLEAARASLEEDPRLAAVSGRCRERFPEASVYNSLMDIEWNTPVGDALAVAGNSMIRLAAFHEVNGFDETFAAGEEPEMCFRMRDRGWKFLRIDAEMAQHDAAIHSWRQWWMRNVRGGSAYAQGAWVHGRSAERYNLKDSARIWFWAGAVPLCAVSFAPLSLGGSLLGAASGYGLVLNRMYRSRLRAGDTPKAAFNFSVFNLLGKFPQLQGQIQFLRRRGSRLIEYK